MTTRKTLGEHIRGERARRKLTQADLAKKVGASARRVIDWELHGVVPDEPHRANLVRELGIPKELFTRKGATGPLPQKLAKIDARLQELEGRVARLYLETARGFEALGHPQHGLGDQGEDQKPQRR